MNADPTSMHLFVTGGTGYLGRELVRQARRQHWQVAASYHSQVPPEAEPIRWLPLDVCDAGAVEAACASLRPAVVVHTAFRQNDPDMWQVNVHGAEHVARAAHAVGARLIHISTDVIFDGERVGPYRESDPPSPVTPYGAAKAEAERLVAAAHPDAVLVRTSLIYGFDPVDRHTRFVLDIADGQRDARLFTDEYRCPVFVGDLAAAVLELAGTHGPDGAHVRGVINLAGSEPLSRYEFGWLLAAYYGRDPASLASGLSAETPGRRPHNCTLDTSLARHTLRTPLRGVREVLAGQRHATSEHP